MAPVIRDADALNLRGMARAIREVGNKAKERKLTGPDMSGSTFTISNPGPMGTYASAAVINQPNVAILTTEGVARRVVAVGDAIAMHHTCVLGLSYDHRALRRRGRGAVPGVPARRAAGPRLGGRTCLTPPRPRSHSTTCPPWPARTWA